MHTLDPSFQLRPASLNEVYRLNTLIIESARGLSFEYTSDEIEELIAHVFGVDTELIEDRSYFVLETQGMLVACGGWSRRLTLFGGDNCSNRAVGVYLDPTKDAAKIRAFFVHPNFARMGLAMALLLHCEQAARLAGFEKIELMSTLTGVKFYAACGYQVVELTQYTLPTGRVVGFKKMAKCIGPASEV